MEKVWARLSQADQHEYFCAMGEYLQENSCWSMLFRLVECYCTGGTRLKSLEDAAGFLDALAQDQLTRGGKLTGKGAVPVNLRRRRRRKANKLITFIRILIQGNRYGGKCVIKQASLYTIIMNGSIENLQGFYREIKESNLGFHRNTMLHLIDRLSNIPTWKEALSILEDLTPEDGKKLTLTRAWAIFQTMFYQATFIGQEECNAVIKKMLECGITPTTETYNIIMSRAVREGNGDNLRLAFREMMATNLTPTMVTYGVLHKFYKESRKEEERQMVIRDALILDRRLNVILATDILHSKVLNKASYLEVHEEFSKFFHPGPLGLLGLTTPRGYVGGKLHPDPITVSIMIYAFCREDRGLRRVWKTYQRYFAISRDRENPHRTTLLSAGSFIPNAFMLAFGRNGSLNYCAVVLENMMRPESPIRPGVVSWSILLHALGKKGKMDQVERVLDIMTQRGFKANAITWASLLSAYMRHNQLYKAGEVISRMRMAEVQPSQATLDTLREYLDSPDFLAGARGEPGSGKQ